MFKYLTVIIFLMLSIFVKAEPIAKKWSEIETQKEAFKALVTLRDEIANMDISLEAMIEKNWLKIPIKRLNYFNQNGISDSDVTNFLADVVQQQTTAALTEIPVQLSTRIPPTLPFEQYAGFCKKQRTKASQFIFSKLKNDIFKKCDEIVSNLFLERATQQIHKTKEEFLALKGTKEDLINTQGYNLRSNLPKLRGYYNVAFKRANEVVHREFIKAESEVEGSYKKAIASTSEEIKLAFANADPLTEMEQIPISKCEQFRGKNRYYNKRLSPINSLCRQLQKNLSEQKEVIRCDRVWEDMEAPKGIQQGSLTMANFLGSTDSINIRKLMCDSHKKEHGLNIVKNKKWFSTNYRLTRTSTSITGDKVTFSANLIKPEKDSNEWKLNKPQIIPKTYLDINKLKSSDTSILMNCFVILAACGR